MIPGRAAWTLESGSGSPASGEGIKAVRPQKPGTCVLQAPGDPLLQHSLLYPFKARESTTIGNFSIFKMSNTQPSAVTDAKRLKEDRDTGSVSGSTASASVSSSEAQTGRELVVAHQARNTRFFARFRYHILATGLALLLSPLSLIWSREGPVDPTDYAERTRRVLNTTP